VACGEGVWVDPSVNRQGLATWPPKLGMAGSSFFREIVEELPTWVAPDVRAPAHRVRQDVRHASAQQMLVPARSQFGFRWQSHSEFNHPLIGKWTSGLYSPGKGELTVQLVRMRQVPAGKVPRMDSRLARSFGSRRAFVCLLLGRQVPPRNAGMQKLDQIACDRGGPRIKDCISLPPLPIARQNWFGG
jgi:hypothetical protein